MISASSSTTPDILQFRKRFPILERSVYLNSCAKGALCDAVRAAYHDFLDDWDVHGAAWPLWMEKAHELRSQFAAFIGAKPHEIALTQNASSGANGIASAMTYERRSKVLLSDQEYPTMAQIWLAQEQSGAKVRILRSRGAFPTPSDYGRTVDEETLIVPLTHVSFRNGSTLPVKEITEICHRHGAYVLLDDYQCTGTRPINVKELGVDFLVTGMVKYMLGPPGIAFLYVHEDLISKLRPRVTGWFGRADPFSLEISELSYVDSAQRFETGTFAVDEVYASLAAINVLSSFGLERIARQVSLITQRVLPAVGELGFTVTTPQDSCGPMVAMEVDELYPLLAFLKERNILIAGRNNLFRVSFHGYNTIEDTEVLLDALEEWVRRPSR